MGFSVTISGIIVLAIFFIAVATSASLIIKAYTNAVHSIEEVADSMINRMRASILITNAYVNYTEGVLYFQLNNTGSLDLWNFNSTDIILIYWNISSGTQSSSMLAYGSGWKVIGIISDNSTLQPFRGYIPPGKSALIATILPQNIDLSKGIRIDVANQYGYVASYELNGGG